MYIVNMSLKSVYVLLPKMAKITLMSALSSVKIVSCSISATTQ